MSCESHTGVNPTHWWFTLSHAGAELSTQVLYYTSWVDICTADNFKTVGGCYRESQKLEVANEGEVEATEDSNRTLNTTGINFTPLF